MKKTLVAIAACTLLGTSFAYAQTNTDSNSTMTTGRAAAESNNQPGTKAGTPTKSVPSNNESTGSSNSTNSGK